MFASPEYKSTKLTYIAFRIIGYASLSSIFLKAQSLAPILLLELAKDSLAMRDNNAFLRRVSRHNCIDDTSTTTAPETSQYGCHKQRFQQHTCL